MAFIIRVINLPQCVELLIYTQITEEVMQKVQIRSRTMKSPQVSVVCPSVSVEGPRNPRRYLDGEHRPGGYLSPRLLRVSGFRSALCGRRFGLVPGYTVPTHWPCFCGRAPKP